MKNKILNLTAGLAMLLSGHHALAQGTAFTYQGELSDGSSLATGSYDFQFTVRDAAAAGSAVGLSPLSATLQVNSGRFTVILDPGANVFTGPARWLEISVRTNGGGAFAALSPSQVISAAPYASFAAGSSAAGLSGTISSANIANGTISSSMLAAGAVNSTAIATGAVSSAALGTDVGVWSVNGANVFRNGGNVGIGVTNPGAALHLNGSMKINNSSVLEFGAGVAGKELSAGKIGYQLFSVDSLDLVGAGTNVAGRRVRFWAEGGALFTGNISAPSATLSTLNGNVSVGGALSASSATIPTLNGNVSVAGILGSGGAFSAPSATISNLNGNVNIGGTLTAGGTFTAPSASIPILNGNVSVSANLTAGGAISAASATIPALNGNVGVSGSLTTTNGIKINGSSILEFGANVAGKELNAGKFGYEIFGPGALDIVGAGNSSTNRQVRVWAEGGVQITGNLNAPSASIPTLNGNVNVNGEMTAKVVTITGGSDVAEPYHVASFAEVEPVAGMVVSIDPDKIGQMRVSSRAYDKTVAGILSGANGIAPGITLRQVGTIADGSLPVASIGRVWCYCDADAKGPIEAGDMLTTSNTPGHAMKVSESALANGSVIGKAMSPLKTGRGLVLVLVSLK